MHEYLVVWLLSLYPLDGGVEFLFKKAFDTTAVGVISGSQSGGGGSRTRVQHNETSKSFTGLVNFIYNKSTKIGDNKTEGIAITPEFV
jgi:hypothetical protein